MGDHIVRAVLAACLYASAASAQTPPLPSIARPEAPADRIRVTLLGTGVGPPMALSQFGPSTLIEAGGKRLLFDCGRGATFRLAQVGVPTSSVTRVFLTHLHSDHVVQLPDLFLTPWVNANAPGRSVPLEVWGPVGTLAMMEAMQQAFAFDIHVRRDIDEHFPADGIRVVSHDIRPGVVFDEDGVKVTAFLVDHAPIEPAFGYRVDFRGHSVVLSGDTKPSENLVRHAIGVDVLVHEAFDATGARARSRNPRVTETVIAHHTTPEQAGRLFARVKPRLAVFSHAQNSPTVVAEARQFYSGAIEGAEDLLTIEIGESIEVQHFSP